MPSLSFFQNLSLFVHFLGFGTVFAMMFAGPLVEKQFRTATDWGARARLAVIHKTFGAISPIVIVILLATGIGNMMTFGFSLADAFSPVAWWLGVKIVLFVFLAMNGVLVAKKTGEQRGKIIQLAMAGNAPADAEAQLQATYSRMSMFFRLQSLALLIVVVMAVFRP